MKTNLIFGLAVVAAIAFSASQICAQEAPVAAEGAAVAQATTAVPSAPCQECQECEGGVAIGAGIGAGFGGVRGGFGGFAGARPDFRQRINDRIASDRPIVEASPFANPNGSLQDWQRFRYYPYAYYPHNFSDRANMSIPKYHPGYQNYYPAPRRYHEGHHFHLDVF